MSCVAEAMAINKQIAATIAKLAFKSSPANNKVPIKIKLWQNSIQLRRWPSHLYKIGSFVRSMSGDHKKLIL